MIEAFFDPEERCVTLQGMHDLILSKGIGVTCVEHFHNSVCGINVIIEEVGIIKIIK